ncbi:hypothetical protein [Acetobacter fallax]|nr:hypothetical protein [Acetobacter fallax]
MKGDQKHTRSRYRLIAPEGSVICFFVQPDEPTAALRPEIPAKPPSPRH